MEENETVVPKLEVEGTYYAELQARLRLLERRDTWLWATALILLLLLCAGVAVLTTALMLPEHDASLQLQMGIALRGLIGLVLLFSLHVLYQQLLIRRLRGRLVQQTALSSRLGMKAEKFQRLALMDSLTELYNRRFAMERLQAEMNRATRHERHLTLLLLDLNGLKTINDRFGHKGGDQALTAFAERLRKAVRGSDFPARIGGDEFLVILPECPPELVPRVLARMSGLEIDIDNTTVSIGYAAGWAPHEPGETEEEFVRRVDQILYRNKETIRMEERNRQAKAPVGKA